MLRMFVFSGKSMLNCVGIGALTATAGVTHAVACDPPVGKPAVVATSFAVVVQTRSVKSVEEQLADALKSTQEFVRTCHSEVDQASRQVEIISNEQAKLIETQNNAVEKISALRNLLGESGCSVCIDGKSFSKETIAEVLLKQLEGFENRDLQLDAVNVQLQQAKTALAEAKVKAQRWKSAEQLLIGRVDRVLAASALRTSQAEMEAAAKEAAVAEAFALADAIEARIARLNESSKSVSLTTNSVQPESSPQQDSSSVTRMETGISDSNSPSQPLQANVAKAIAEFDALFSK